LMHGIFLMKQSKQKMNNNRLKRFSIWYIRGTKILESTFKSITYKYVFIDWE